MATTIVKVLSMGTSGTPLEPLIYRGETPNSHRDGVSFETPRGSAKRLTPINHGPTTRTIEIQTMYRESEVQTDPYSPEYILKPGQPIPEIVQLQSQKFRFPIGPKEILLIERARQRKAKEASLPPLSDPESLEKRKKLLEEMEEDDWKYREEEIRERQLSKLEYYKETILVQEQERELINTYKLQSITFRSNAKKDGRVAQIEQQRLRTLRKLAKDREYVERKPTKRDIIQEYSDYTSKVYAPVTRDGGLRETLILQDIKPPTLASLAGLETLQTRVFKSTTHSGEGKVTIPGSDKRVITITERAEKELAGNLEKLEESIKASKIQSKAKLPLPSVAEKIEKPPPRPPTPEVVATPAIEEEVEQAVLLLQYLLRGRAIQTLMYEGKERRKELMNELKSAEDYNDVEIQEPVTVESQIKKEHERKKLIERRKKQAMGVFDDILGYIVGSSLDFLSKELVRVQEEERIAAMVEIAETTRKDRENNEISQREREHQLRLNQDEQFRQIMEIHQGTATTFFEDCLEDAYARIQTRKAIAKKLAEEEEERRLALLPLPPEQVIADVVFGFLFPLVERKTIQRAALLEDKKFPKAAWDAIEEITSRTQQV